VDSDTNKRWATTKDTAPLITMTKVTRATRTILVDLEVTKTRVAVDIAVVMPTTPTTNTKTSTILSNMEVMVDNRTEWGTMATAPEAWVIRMPCSIKEA